MGRQRPRLSVLWRQTAKFLNLANRAVARMDHVPVGAKYAVLVWRDVEARIEIRRPARPAKVRAVPLAPVHHHRYASVGRHSGCADEAKGHTARAFAFLPSNRRRKSIACCARCAARHCGDTDDDALLDGKLSQFDRLATVIRSALRQANRFTRSGQQ